MYEGYLQHDAQEVLQCLLAYIQEACDTIRKEQHGESTKEVIQESPATLVPANSEEEEEDGQVNGKRKSDTEAGNAKKKPKSVKSNKLDADEHSEKKPFTRSKRRSSREIVADADPGEREVKDEGKEENEEVACSGEEGKGTGDGAPKASEGKRKKRTRITAPPDAPTRAPSGRHIPLCRQRFEEASERHADGIRDRGRVTVMNAFEIRQIMID